jgi:Flp pilus assembly protein TadG
VDLRGVHRLLQRFSRATGGGVAVEFALLVLPFLMVIIAIVELGAKSLIQADLDRVLTEVTSNLSYRSNNAADAREYIDSVICSTSGPLLDCGGIDIGAVVVSGRLFNYRNQSLAGSWTLGCGGDTVLIEMTYAYQDFLIPFAVADVVEVGGQKRYRSRTVIRREPILSGAGACAS